jgi:energy-coupling factor transporter ATP-binding protein EcfA2
VRIVVSGTHASGKSTLVSDLAGALGHEQLNDPFELLDDAVAPSGADSFVAQLELAAERLVELPPGADAVAERGPLDFLAYLEALADLHRPSIGRDGMARVREITAVAMAHVDLLVVLPLDDCDGIRVPDDEDPELRTAMDERLLDLVDDPELVGSVGTVLAVSGSPSSRLRQVLVAVESGKR